MPIEFNCQVCRQRLSTPDDSAGRQCQCPDCSSLLTIPSRSTVALGDAQPPNNAESASASSQPSASNSRFQKPVIEPSADLLKIPCPRCRFELVCSSSLLGTKGQCRNCQHIFTIASSGSVLAAASESDSPDLVFHCPACSQLFAGQTGMEGKKGKCHACGEVFAIALEPAPVTYPNPSGARPTAPSPSQPSPSVAKPSAPSPAAKPRDNAVMISSSQRQVPIQFHCQSCSGVLEVPGATSGQQTLCPYCGETLTIPATSDSARAQTASRPVVSAVPYPVQTAALVNQTEQNMWTALSDKTSAAQSNPYAAPALSPLDTASSEMWNLPAPSRKRIRGLTFSNAFALMFDSLFPFCLVAPVLFGIAGVTTLIAFLFFRFASVQTVKTLNLVEELPLQILAFGFISCTVLVGVFAFTAAYCMTCNTALHAVRGKKISSRVVFNPGNAYGGMLALWCGVLLFYIFRKSGIPFLAQEIAKVSDPQTATVIALATILILSLVEVVLTYLWTFVPFALLDGQSLPEAMGTSTSISLSHFSNVLPTLIAGRLLFVIFGVISIGFGFVILMGAILYLSAAIYHLAED